MDEVSARPRYVRHTVQSKRRRKIVRDESSISDTIMRQAMLSILLLLIIGLLKSAGTPVTGYLMEKVSDTLTYDMQLSWLNSFVDGVFGKDGTTSGGKNDDALPAAGDVSIDLIAPIEGVITSPFGDRIHPVRQIMELHEGIDIEAEQGAAIKAAMDGVVVKADSSAAYGNYVRIRHGTNLETLYAHCSQLSVSQGEKVKQGDIIAKAGDTGVSVGTHLHFELWVDGKAVDPAEYLEVPIE